MTDDQTESERFFAGFDKQTLHVRAPWSREAEEAVNRLIGEVAAKELECQRLRETLNFIATHLSSDWPDRCRENVRAARRALGQK